MKKSKLLLVILICILIYPIIASSEEIIDKDYLDSKLALISDNYSFSTDNDIRGLLTEEVNRIISNEEIEKNVECENLVCNVELKYGEIISDKKQVNITIENSNTNVSPVDEPVIIFNSHVQKIGWQGEKKKGILGTTGRSLRLEAFKIKIDNIDGDIEYKSFVDSYGWDSDWKHSGEVSGTVGQSRRIEAIKLRLSGNASNNYDIYYRVHVQNIGWLGWAKNGELAGTLGYDKNVEAVEVKLVEKNSGEETGNSYKRIDSNLLYNSHIQNVGWQSNKNSGISGTPGKNLRLEALNIKLINPDYSGDIEYSAHIQSIGWQSVRKNGATAGTTGKKLRIEALKINLTGEIAEIYDVYYRVYISNFGWLGWAKNGELAGSTGLGMQLEGYEIKLVDKGTDEETGNSYVEKNDTLEYQTHIRNIGTQNSVGEGQTAGTTGRSLTVEALNINLNTQLDGKVLYKTFIRKDGWENDWKESGDFAGTIGKAKEIQNVMIKLEGEIAEKYDIYYRVHSSNYGWLGWAKNGEIAGVNHYGIEAIQIKLVFKNDLTKDLINTKNHYIEKVSYRPVYYNQKDSRWANIYYGRKMGSTGCAPTAMAMAFTGILHRTILPVDVAYYLYYHTNEFNKRTAGSSGQAIILASKHFDVKYNPLRSKNEIINALKDGKIVYAAMGNGRFAKATYNHAIIVFGYNSNGTTNPYDPLNRLNNYQVSIDLLIREQSKDPDDYSGGSNFYSLERY